MTSREDRVDALFAEWDKPTSPGCVLAVIRDGAIIYQRGYGMADLERGVPVTPESLFDLGSTGKQFTAALIAIFANRGLLSLDDPIRKYIPEMPPYAGQVTIRHLLHHTGGVRDYLTLMGLSGLTWVNEYPEAMLLELLTRQPRLNFAPGSEYMYSNGGYFLLGTIASRAGGKHYTELLREHILEPLGMQRTTSNKDFRPIVPDRALSYDPGEEEGSFVNSIAMSGGFGDGALLSCVGDLLLWDSNFYANQLNDAQPDLIEQMQTPGVLNDGQPIAYALGLSKEIYKGQTVFRHAGSWAGYICDMLRFPDQRLTVICLCNLSSMDPEHLANQVADIYLEDVLGDSSGESGKEQAAPEFSASELAARTGVYQGRNHTYAIFLKDGKLYFTGGKNEFELIPTGKTSFQITGQSAHVIYSGRDYRRIALVQSDGSSRKMRRVRLERYTPETLQSYEGEYYCAEMDVRYRLSAEEGALYLRRTPYDQPVEVHPFTENTFRTRIGELRLRLNKAGEVKGFVLHSWGVRDVKFKKR